jgi:hypothetical protein
MYERARNAFEASLGERDSQQVRALRQELEDAIREVESQYRASGESSRAGQPAVAAAPDDKSLVPPKPPSSTRDRAATEKSSKQANKEQEASGPSNASRRASRRPLTNLREAAAFAVAQALRLALVYAVGFSNVLSPIYRAAQDHGGITLVVITSLAISVVWPMLALPVFAIARGAFGGAPRSISLTRGAHAFRLQGREVGAYILAVAVAIAAVSSANALVLTQIYAELLRSKQTTLAHTMGVGEGAVVAALMFLAFVLFRSAFTLESAAESSPIEAPAGRAAALAVASSPPSAGPIGAGRLPSGFVDPRLRTTVLQIALGVFFCLRDARFAFVSSLNLTPRELFDDSRFTLILSLLSLVAELASAIVFSMWIVRVARNVRALGATGLEFTPGWAVGWFFVPIANFFKPFQAMREIWKASKNPLRWREEATGRVVGWWWLGFLAMTVVDYLASDLGASALGLDRLRTATGFFIASDFLHMFAVLPSIVLVSQVCQFQIAASNLRSDGGRRAASLRAPDSDRGSAAESSPTRTANLPEARPAADAPVAAVKGGSNWYFVEDKTRSLRQVVLVSEPQRAVKSRYGMLLLTQKHYALNRNPLATGLVHLDGDTRTFLLLRTDGLVEEVRRSSLRVGISFFHLPTSGLVAFYVSCQPLQEKTRMGFEEQIYGLDFDETRDPIANVLNSDCLYIVHAGEGGAETVLMETGERMYGPACKYDVEIPYDKDCKALLLDEWNAVLRHHRSIRNPDFQAAGRRLYELMPENVNPILER